MKQLPNPDIYEEECRTTPWGLMIKAVVKEVIKRAPREGSLIDLMCGPGYLLNKIVGHRPDLRLRGIDNDSRFVRYAKKEYTSSWNNVRVWQKDVLLGDFVAGSFNVITCTAGLHHLPYDKQEPFLEKVAGALRARGVAIIGDPYISDYNNELERRLGAAELGDAFTTAAIRGEASDEVIKAAIDVMYNDIFGHEYKTSVAKTKEMFKKHFHVAKQVWTWRPNPQKEFGDCYFVLGNK